MKKYELTDETITINETQTLYRIKALRDFGDVKAGDLGGYVESESNLSHEGNCWIYDDAIVSDSARIYDSAKISGDAEIYYSTRIGGSSEIL
jgi:UDP-3-O-[3-hydroxymyristoyl] glucosamine N-acyltransferase